MSIVGATAFFDKTYGDAMHLLLEARTYMTQGEPRDRAKLALPDRLRLSCETMRITARLTQVMAWLLAQRAVQAGELSPEQAVADPCPLAELDICMGDGEAEGVGLPAACTELLGRSQRLYQRVARLDEMTRRQLA